MGNYFNKMKTHKARKTLTDANVVELASLSGFTPEKVREWYAAFMVSNEWPRINEGFAFSRLSPLISSLLI